jgi:putative acyl-CoA dehydrogenase
MNDHRMNDHAAAKHTAGQLAETHRVENVPPPFEDYDSWLGDAALREAVRAFGGGWGEAGLAAFGVECGSAERIAWGFQANQNLPRLRTHDRFGHRVDEVDYHPAYHQLMTVAKSNHLHALPWVEPKPGAHVVRAALLYLQTQVEAGHGCPVVMTFACVPTLHKQPDIAADWLPKITNAIYDPRNLVHTRKDGLTIGMAMTEKQGGSDVRANSTRAFPLGAGGPGAAYELVGHKFFVSAPMSDGFLMLAYSEGGLSCFLVPRWRPDGSKNPIQINQLKDKMGNVSNASCETELRGALGWMIGAEGRGVANILEMVALTRFDCAVASAAGMRQAAAQALHHCRHRSAFGARLVDQPLMQNVLADLALEAEAATWLGLRLAQALDRSADDEGEALLLRLGTAVGKYWNCKRAPGHAYEAMECIGGSGVMETTMMPRLYREARSTRSGRAAATCSAWTCCAPSARRPRAWRLSCRRSAGPPARTPCGRAAEVAPGAGAGRGLAALPGARLRRAHGAGLAGLPADPRGQRRRQRRFLRGAAGRRQWRPLRLPARRHRLPGGNRAQPAGGGGRGLRCGAAPAGSERCMIRVRIAAMPGRSKSNIRTLAAPHGERPGIRARTTTPTCSAASASTAAPSNGARPPSARAAPSRKPPGRLAAEGGQLHRPDHPGRRRHAGPRAAPVPEGQAAGARGPARRPGDGRPGPDHRRGLRLP